MVLLANDIIQFSDATPRLKSAALSNRSAIAGTLTLNLDRERFVDCIGIGNTDATYFTVNGERIDFDINGLYLLKTPLNTGGLVIETDGTYLGRIGAGRGLVIGTQVRKEPGFFTTEEPRKTLGGQIIDGLGGYDYNVVSLDSRYQIDMSMLLEFKEGRRTIARGYPFFINLEKEAYKLTFDKMYAIDRNQRTMSFESGIINPRFSRRWEFEECF